ncbi:hypothetical protein [Blastococcus haudaquaticus]|uniref:Uncharacterized protein n=1 Tax=Blastococcus haudaquaticus TaxID=1938745 RepID=A0A286GGI3_9ACTN|nr:hypothetical protein [Blastococcus haudaquaticus]SOD94633.1 hypothetical protein SAMN06272739_0936 [Blastococcus haudaquaticus]
MTDEDRRTERLAVLTAIGAALEDPIRLLQVITGAADDEDAVRRVAAAFAVTEPAARVLMDLQFGRLTRAARDRLTEELRILRADWGPPVEARLVLTGRTALLSVDGTERRFTAGGVNALLDEVVGFLRSEIAVSRLRPVAVVVTGRAAGPVGMTVRPDGSASFGYEDRDG